MRRPALFLAAILLSTLAFARPPALFSATPLAFTPAPAAKVVGVYVPSWESSALVDDLKQGSVTHLIYAFLHVCGPGVLAKDAAACVGKVDFQLADSAPAADFDAAFLRLKKRMPTVKVVASVGGWGGSDPFFHLAATPAGRAAFVASCMEFLRAHPGFDGIDIDWEHPGNNGAANGVQLGSPEDGRNYADLMIDLRAGLDGLGQAQGRRYLLTVAVNPTQAVVKRVDYARAAPPLDLVFMMSYDYYGNWSAVAGQHTDLRASHAGADDSLEESVQNLLAAGVPASKLVAGVAMYGRGFSGVTEVRNGAAKTGDFPPASSNGDAGSATYKDIVAQWLGKGGGGINGFRLHFDATTRGYSLYNAKTHDWLSYDDPRAVLAKGRFVLDHHLAGLFAWELSQDNGDLLNAMNLGVGNRPKHDR